MLLPPWTNRALSPPALLGLAVAILVLSSPGCAQGPPIPAAGVMAAEGGQVQVAGAPPGEQPAAAARVFQPAQRGDVIQAVVARGEVEPAHMAELVCRVRGRGPNKPAATIKWVIDDGALVQKGDRLLELDDSALQEELKGQETAVAEKQALLVQAEAALKVAEASGKNAADSGRPPSRPPRPT